MSHTARTVVYWLVSFAGFPLGGVAAIALTGPVDGILAAATGGLVTGAVLGAVQGWALRGGGRLVAAWTVATAVGLSCGLTAGAALVGFRTGLADLALLGAVSGAAVGIAQAVVLVPRLGARAALWPLWLALVWAAGWAVTTTIGVDVEARYTVFGSSGAVLVTLLTLVLPLALAARRPATAGVGS